MKKLRLPKKITARWLDNRCACLSQVQLFEETFPKGAPLTAASVRKAEKAGLNVAWACYRLVWKMDCTNGPERTCPKCRLKRLADKSPVLFLRVIKRLSRA